MLYYQEGGSFVSGNHDEHYVDYENNNKKRSIVVVNEKFLSPRLKQKSMDLSLTTGSDRRSIGKKNQGTNLSQSQQQMKMIMNHGR